MFFSVVLPTRDRPELFAHALRSVCQQKFDDYEILVVDDGSAESEAIKINELVDEIPNARLLRQPRRPNGHGQSYSMNTGAFGATGRYLAFLDDDDTWVDPLHLQRAAADIAGADHLVDAYYTNQHAYFSNGQRKEAQIWLEDLIHDGAERSGRHGQSVVAGAAQALDCEALLQSKGFAHLNCSIIRREFYLQIGGMDEGIRYECDRDFYLRTLDQATGFLYSPRIVGRHNIPDPKRADNMSTVISALQKAQYQTAVYQKGLLHGRRATVRENCRIGLGYVYKRMTTLLYSSGDDHLAYRYACKGLALHGNWKWAAYTAYLAFVRYLPKRVG